MKNPRQRKRWSPRRGVVLAGAVLVAIAVIASIVIWNASRLPAEQDTEVVRAARTDETTTVSLAGVLAPQQQANVSFAVPGTVRTIDVKVGDLVAVGQQLASVEDRDLSNAVTLAEAQATAARAQLQTVRDAAQATSAQVAAARAQVESADAGVTQARDRLADARLGSPLAGVVAEVSIEVGDQVSGSGALPSGGSLPGGLAGVPGGLAGVPGASGLSGLSGLTRAASSNGGGASAAQVVVVVPDSWKLEADVGTADLPQLQPGQLAVVTPTGTSQHVAATVDTVGIVASAASGQAAMFPVTLRVTDPNATLFSGSNADAVVTTGTVRDVLTVPAEAIWITNGRPTVRRQVGGDVRVDEVTVGRRFGERIEITAGVAEGDEVIARRSVVVTPPARPQFGPGGTFVSPGPTPTQVR